MATRKGKYGRISYEGEQYRGGRSKDIKNLIRTDGGYTNQHGVTFSEEQKKALERAVNRSNYQRKKMLAEAEALNPHKTQLRLMEKEESDFIISRQSKSLQQFKSMEAFERFMDKQERIRTGEYLDDATRLYKSNYMQALENAFGDEAKGIKMKIRMMKPEEYRKMVENDEFLEIGYLYEPDAVEGKLSQIRRSLNMKPVEDAFSPY